MNQTPEPRRSIEYGSLISRSFQITWRHKHLWLLGLLAGSGAGTCNTGVSGGNFSPGQVAPRPSTGSAPSELEDLPLAATYFMEEVGQFVQENLGLILLGVAGLVLLGIVLWVLSLIAQGGLIAAVGRIESGERMSLGGAWRLGIGRFWSFFALWIAIGAIGLVVALVFAVGLVLLIVPYFTIADPQTAASFAGLFIILALLSLIGLLVLLPAAILFSIVFALAQRAVAVDGSGPFAALGAGWRLLRTRFADSLILWVIGVGLLIAAATATVMILAIPAIPLGIMIVGLVTSSGLTGSNLLAIVLSVIALILVAALVSSPFNTFFWTYWTLAYLRLTGR